MNDFLDADELAQWCEAITSTVEANARPLTGKNSEMAFTQRMHLRRVDDRVRRLVDDRCIGRLVATLEGVDALRLYLDQALVKEPYGAPTQYHLDIPWWAFDSEHACTSGSGKDSSRSAPAVGGRSTLGS